MLDAKKKNEINYVRKCTMHVSGRGRNTRASARVRDNHSNQLGDELIF